MSLAAAVINNICVSYKRRELTWLANVSCGRGENRRELQQKGEGPRGGGRRCVVRVAAVGWHVAG